MTQGSTAAPALAAAGATIKTMRNRWMGFLIGPNPTTSLRFTDLTVPGTHDTGTWNVPAGNASRCQTMTLQDQLEHGIRFIDIRLVPELNNGSNDLMIYHGDKPSSSTRCNVWFSDIVDTCSDFLRDNDTETIIMSIKNEWNVADATFTAALDPFLNNTMQQPNPAEPLFYTGDTVPVLTASKGHIVLLRRYTGSAKGIDGVTDWPDDSATTAPTAGPVPKMIQDVFRMRFADQGDKKFSQHIAPFLTDAANKYPDGNWWINFTSASGGGAPWTFADEINPLLQDFLEQMIVLQQKNGPYTFRLGTVIMDFPTPRLIDNLIAMNIVGSSTQVLQGKGYKLSLSNGNAYIGKAFYYAGDEWNYAQCYMDGNIDNAVPHSFIKVAGSGEYELAYGDTVRIMSSQFSNDIYIYLESVGSKGKGINLFYDDEAGSYQKNSQAVEWIIEWSPANNTPGKQGAVEKGDIIRFRSVLNTNHYLLAATDQYLAVAPVSTNPNGGVTGGFDWVIG
ncbi:phosphatidylinositol-specific phospholipase C domain-containing protein [Chitinophagaceae bacterium MMS25-I14]